MSTQKNRLNKHPKHMFKLMGNNIFTGLRSRVPLYGTMLKMSRGLYTGGNFKQNTWEKKKENLEPYLRS